MNDKTIKNVFLMFLTVLLMVGDFALAQGPENTLVVVNAESADSLCVANYYIHIRDIPACNVVYLEGITTSKKFGEESSSSKAFDLQIRQPVMRAMKQRGIEKQISCIAYSAGFPTRVNIQPQKNKYLKQTSKRYNLQLHAPWASLTSLTYFQKNVFSDRPDFLELDANQFALLRPPSLSTNPFIGSDADEFLAARASLDSGDYVSAKDRFLKLGKKHPMQMAVVFPLARCLARLNEKDKAVAMLQHAASAGFNGRSLIENEPAFEALKTDPRFQKALAQISDQPAGVLPTRSFSNHRYWSVNGWPNGTPDQGESYLLSSVLAVTGKNQSSLKDSLRRLESSVKADGTAPQGHVYFADHKDPRSRTRKRQFAKAAEELRLLGVDASVGGDKMPRGQKRVIGATLGSAVLDWKKSGSKFLPGAICDNFTSYGGWWQKTSQTQLNEFLDAGAAGACGTVYEPYTIATKIPSARWHAHYARGATLAESFYQSVSGPFQILLVGDPLCCPFGKFPKFTVSTDVENKEVQNDFEMAFNIDSKSPPIERFEIFVDGVYFSRVGNDKPVKIAVDRMNDGYHKIRVVGIANVPTKNRFSQSFGFVVNRRNRSVRLEISQKKIKLGQDLTVVATSDLPGDIRIIQNYRTVAKVRSGKRTKLNTATLGAGTINFQASSRSANGGLVFSTPVSIEIVSDGLR